MTIGTSPSALVSFISMLSFGKMRGGARVPQRQMGAIAARMLINLLEHEAVHERHIRLDAELVVRGSTAAARTAGRRVA